MLFGIVRILFELTRKNARTIEKYSKSTEFDINTPATVRSPFVNDLKHPHYQNFFNLESQKLFILVDLYAVGISITKLLQEKLVCSRKDRESMKNFLTFKNIYLNTYQSIIVVLHRGISVPLLDLNVGLSNVKI